MSRRRPYVLLAVAPLLLLLTAAAAEDSSGDLDQRLLAPSQVEPLSAAELQQVLEHHRGKTILVNLWATWCIPCVQELPELNLLQQRYAERGLKVIAVSMDKPEKLESKVRPFFAEIAPDLVSYLADDVDEFAFVEPLDPEWIGGLPTTFFVDRDGEVRATQVGRMLYQQIEKQVLALLEE